MNVILRNLLALTSEGAFGTAGTVIPMSDFKWDVLCKLAVLEDVAPYVYKAVVNHNDDPNVNVPQELKASLGKMPFGNQDGLSLSFDLNNIDGQNLTYSVKRYILKDIVYKEKHSIDTSKISLDFLSVVLQNTNLILRNGIRLRGIIEIGLFLRGKGQYVDFVKVEAWIRRLKLKRMASLQAGVLVGVFSFGSDEFPYIRKFDKKGKRLTQKSLERVARANRLDRTFGKYSIVNLIKYYRYSHSEALCKAVSNMLRSLSEIEE